MKQLFRTVRLSPLWVSAVALLACVPNAFAQDETDAPYESKFVDVGEVQLQYLDFGGEGLPIVFLHSYGSDQGASTWKNFAPRFTKQYRALAIRARGAGKSKKELADIDVATRGQDIIGLLDTLGIERAVFMGNASPARDMTYLAEHHPGRVAGLVYLSHAPEPSFNKVMEADTTGALEMSVRALYQGELPPPYRPEYLRSPGSNIDVPALTFVASTGTRGWVNHNYPLLVAKRVSKEGTDWIADPEAKAFLTRLTDDEELQRRVQASWKENVVPVIRKSEKAFERAFGEDLRFVQLDLPFVTGYEYKNAPEQIEPHIRSFLKELSARESAQ